VARSADPVTPAAYSGSCKHINGSSANVVPANGVKAGCKFDAQICASVSQIPLSLDMRRRSTPADLPIPADLLKEKPEIRFDGDRVSIRLGKYKIEF